jgi:putative ABC transport system substrate-binding protein
MLAARHVLPMISAVRELTVAGGLISYGNSLTDAYRRAGLFAGRILKGAKPADMPVDRATKYESSSILARPRRSASKCF